MNDRMVIQGFLKANGIVGRHVSEAAKQDPAVVSRWFAAKNNNRAVEQAVRDFLLRLKDEGKSYE